MVKSKKEDEVKRIESSLKANKYILDKKDLFPEFRKLVEDESENLRGELSAIKEGLK